jgi:hypothetical protein
MRESENGVEDPDQGSLDVLLRQLHLALLEHIDVAACFAANPGREPLSDHDALLHGRLSGRLTPIISATS